MRLKELAGVRVRYGYRRLHVLLQREGWQVNAKRVYRLYKQEGLSLRLKTKKKRASAVRVPMPRPSSALESWSMDFVSDSLVSGAKFRALTIVDNFSRVSPAVEVDFSLTGRRVAEVLDRLGRVYGLPKTIRVDNGTEFCSKALDEWAYRKGIKLEFIRPGKPMENGYIESFNGKLREECLNQNWFESIEEARRKIEQWRVEYNEYRPHSALGQETPSAFEQQWQLNRGRRRAGFLTL
jgi:putative transposase